MNYFYVFSLKNLLHLFSYREEKRKEKKKRKYSFYEINSINEE
jgi:hypothetical protein